MAKIKNRILIILALVMLCAVGVFALAACNNTETYTVTFMVRENGTTGDWQQYTTVDERGVRVPAVERELLFGCGGFLFRRRFGKRGERTRNLRSRAAAVRNIELFRRHGRHRALR